MRVVPSSFREVQAFVREHHRHNKPPVGGKVFLGLHADDRGLVGVAVIGRPSARAFDGRSVAEVTRTCVVDAPNGNSMLYGAAARIAKAMGYQKIITYTQEGESGASLRAAGFVCEAALPPRKNWAESSGEKHRGRRDASEPSGVRRYRWAITFTRGQR